jgi:flavin reductase (DIM6/NTAB) family NADH-FMN oxidoreductase RutF
VCNISGEILNYFFIGTQVKENAFPVNFIVVVGITPAVVSLVLKKNKSKSCAPLTLKCGAKWK